MNPPFSRTCLMKKIAIIGAGKVGSTLAQMVVERNIADVVLLDVIAGWPQGIALDLMEARGILRHDRTIIGTNDFADTAGADIVVITAGQPRKPGMSRDDLLTINSQIVEQAATQAVLYSPDAIFIVVTNPLDVMTYLTWRVTGVPQYKVMGMAGILDAARFQAFIAMELGIAASDINAMVLGSHGDLMVPLPQYSTVNSVPITEVLDTATIERLVNRTRNGGAEIVELLKVGSAFYAPAASIRLMIEAILLNEVRLLPCCTYLQGEYGLSDLFLGVPAWLSCQGVEKILELSLTDAQSQALLECGEQVRENIDQMERLLTEGKLSK